MLGVPKKWRTEQYLYKKILKESYPSLFSFPTKNNLGLPIDAPDWRVKGKRMGLIVKERLKKLAPVLKWNTIQCANYVDFNKQIRNPGDLRDVVGENVSDLRSRGVCPWVDIEKLWKNHQSNKLDVGYALLLLASLEINIKGGKIPC